MKKIIACGVILLSLVALLGQGIHQADVVRAASEASEAVPTVSASLVLEDPDAIHITKGGTYTYSGTLSGPILVEAEDDVELVLDGVELSTETVAIFALDGDLTLTLKGDSAIKSTGTEAIAYEDEAIDAAIYAKDDLCIKGEGTLTVESALHGIICKDQLTLSGNVAVKSEKTAIRGKDAILISGANLYLMAGTDGLKSDGEEGSITIEESTIQIQAGDKAIQAAKTILVKSGDLLLNATEDGLHSDYAVYVEGGNISITAGDDAIHGDYQATIDGGTLSITAAEGIESTLIEINDGTITIDASDDGINAAQKTDGILPQLTINGGYLTIRMAQGDTDGLDSNGNLSINGGTVDITASSAVDYDAQGELTGGTLIVNGQTLTGLPNQMMGGGMGGRMGGMGGHKNR